MTRCEVEELVAAKGGLLHRYLLARHHPTVADEALGRAYEILWRHHTRLDVATARSWLFVVAGHEAGRVYANDTRTRTEVLREDVEHPERDHHAVLDAKAVLAALKPDEARALLLHAVGYSYPEIADLTGWTFTKVNRCIYEGRAAARKLLAA